MKDALKSALAAFVLALSLAGSATAEPYDDGVTAYDRGDYATAHRLWRQLADQGHAAAQYALGQLYREGQGVPQSYAAAAMWYRKAAEQGHPQAQLNLGVMYLNGYAVARDHIQAHKWFTLAAALAPTTETETRNMAVRNRNLVAAMMTPKQIAEAHRLAREWKPK